MSSDDANQPLKKPGETPQQALDRFWRVFTSTRRGKALTVLPRNDLADRLFEAQPKDGIVAETATAGYDNAVAKCKANVASIVRECRRINQKYRDLHFDLEDGRICLRDLMANSYEFCPGSVARVGDIFTSPEFFKDGVHANDVQQGRNGDCWFLAAVAAISSIKDLAEKNCVARDEDVGVYGFVFHRDGEWISEIIDDKLYLTKPNYNDSSWNRAVFEEIGRAGLNEDKYRKAFLTGSEALYFAQCREENETWLPLLEKAYAKAHGDYGVIEGGFTGEAIEDLTGGVTTELRTSDILDKKQFWQELLQYNGKFVFSCWTGGYHGGADTSQGGTPKRQGIIEGHAYSIMRAVEAAGEKLVLLRNPWGESEWTGPWSDGSKEWTPAWMERLDHKFGDDGVFWMSYADLIRKFELFDRTRLFGPEWTSTQVWTSLTIPWKIDYHDTKFCFKLDRSALVVIVLSQLDDRYIRGLEGQYSFTLQFRLQKDDDADFIVRSHTNYRMKRSVNTELDLEVGSYTVYVKITANRREDRSAVEDVVSSVSKKDRGKLMQVGMKYDLAHTKRDIRETEDERKMMKAKKGKAKRREQEKQTKKKTQQDGEAKEGAPEGAASGSTENKVTPAATKSTDADDSTKSAQSNAVPNEEGEHKAGEVVPELVDGAAPSSISTTEQSAPAEGGLEPSALKDEENSDSIDPRNKQAVEDPEDPEDSEDDNDADATSQTSADKDDTNEEDKPKDPWNAVAIVGLRVYAQNAKVDLKVVTPKDVDEPTVDADDPAADAQADISASNK